MGAAQAGGGGATRGGGRGDGVGIGLVLSQWQRAEGEWRRAEEERKQAEEARGEAAARAEAENAARRQADDRRIEAQNALSAARRNLYFYHIMRGERDLRAGQTEQAAAMLERCPLDLRAWEWFYLHRQCAGEEVVCPGDEGDFWTLAWSHDGKHIATGASKGTVTLWDADLRHRATLAEAHRRREKPGLQPRRPLVRRRHACRQHDPSQPGRVLGERRQRRGHAI